MIQLIQITLGRSLVDCPTQLALIFILWYLYLSVFHDKCQSYKYEKIQQGNLLEGPSLYGWPNLEYGIWLKRNITSSSPQQWQMFCNDSCVISCFQTECLSYSWIIFSLFFYQNTSVPEELDPIWEAFQFWLKACSSAQIWRRRKRFLWPDRLPDPLVSWGTWPDWSVTSIHKTASSKIIRHPICLDFYFSTTFFLDFYFSTTRSKSKKTLRMSILILCIFPNWWLLPFLATFSTNTAESVTRWLMGRSSNYHSFEAWKTLYWWLTLVSFLPSLSILSFIKLGYSTSICTCVHPVYDEVLS